MDASRCEVHPRVAPLSPPLPSVSQSYLGLLLPPTLVTVLHPSQGAVGWPWPWPSIVVAPPPLELWHALTPRSVLYARACDPLLLFPGKLQYLPTAERKALRYCDGWAPTSSAMPPARNWHPTWALHPGLPGGAEVASSTPQRAGSCSRSVT